MSGITKIIGYLWNYLVKNFHLGGFLFLSIFLGVSIWFNYEYKLEKSMLDGQKGELGFFWWNMLYYAAPYLVGCIAIGIFGKRFDFFKKPGFWLVLFIFCFAL